MLSDGRFWVGVIVGLVVCHFGKNYLAKKASS